MQTIKHPEGQLRKLGSVSWLFGGFLLFLALFIYLLTGRVSTWYFITLIALGFCFILVSLWMHFPRVLEALRSRQAIYGANVAVAAIAAIGTAVLINFIVATAFDKQFDWTASKIHSLSEQSKQILNKLEKPVNITAFFSTDESAGGNDRMRAQKLLELYKQESKQIKVEIIDPVLNPLKANEYKIELPGQTVFESGEKQEMVDTVDEQKFTSAILKVTRDEVKKIYFLRGHNEQDPNDLDERAGYRFAKEALENQNYAVADLYLAAQPEVPSDCATLIIAGPKLPLAEEEVKAIEKYLDAGGKLFVMLDAVAPGVQEDQQLLHLLSKWGVAPQNDLVVDRNLFGSYAGRIEIPFVGNYNWHQITKSLLEKDLLTPFPLSRSVAKIEDSLPPDVTVTVLAETTDQEGVSWGETNRDKDGQWLLEYTPGQDSKAPVSLAVAVQREQEKPESEKEEGSGEASEKTEKTATRLVVVGDSDFATNQFFNRTGAGDFFLNSVNWLTAEEDLIAIRAKPPEQRNLRPLSGGEERFVAFTSIFGIPLLVFLAGVLVWWKRR